MTAPVCSIEVSTAPPGAETEARSSEIKIRPFRWLPLKFRVAVTAVIPRGSGYSVESRLT